MMTNIKRPLPNYTMIDKHGRARLEDYASRRGIGLRELLKYCNRPEGQGGLGRMIGTLAGIRQGEEKGLRDRLKKLSLEEIKELRK